MKAIVYTEYGPPDVLHIQEVAKPVPSDGEILIRVCATHINYGDLTARNYRYIRSRDFHMPMLMWLIAKLSFGVWKPRNSILGNELAGEVEAVGKDVTRFRPGDQVYAYCGMSMGANAEYMCMPETGTVAIKPANLTYEEAACLPYGAIMASSLLRLVEIRSGQKVLIHGASGGIGSMAVQLARHNGAEVTGTCSPSRVAFVRGLGADRVIDYTREDFTTNGERYDLIFDILGKGSFPRFKDSLTEHGRYLLASFKMRHVFQMLATSRSGGRRVICGLANERAEDLDFVRELAEAGQVKAIIDKCYPMEQAAEAHRYVEGGGRAGSVVLTLRPVVA